MTLLADRPSRPDVRLRPWRARVWAAPVWAHLVALAVLLVLLVPVIGTGQSFLADEGAAVIQARSLAAGHGWTVDHPLPQVDPTGAWYPVVNAEHGQKGFAPLAKLPAYPALAAVADRWGGVAGMVLLSLAGTLAAAGLAGLLAGRIDATLVRPTLWAVGVASPLLFDGYLVMAHALGAALATGAVLAAVVAIQDRRPAVALLVAPGVAGAVLLRNEALLFAAALALVAGALAVRRAYRTPAAAVAVATVGAAIAARLVDRLWLARVTGGAVAATGVGVPAAGAGLVKGRIDGFLLTWLTPGYGGPSQALLALVVMAGAIGWCGLRVRSRPDDRVGIVGSAGVAALAAVVAVVVAPSNVVPGLLLAFPVAAAGLVVLRRRLFDGPAPVVIGATGALYALAVIATQYSVGGSGEWGGRYFALLVPAAVPLFLAGLWQAGASLRLDVRRVVAGALVVCSLAMSIMAVDALRVNHRTKADLVAGVEAAGRTTGDDRPVVVTDWIGAPRLAWATFDDHRWLYVPKDQVATALDRLRAAGIGRFVFVTRDLGAVRRQLDGTTVVSTAGAADGEGRQILVVES